MNMIAALPQRLHLSLKVDFRTPRQEAFPKQRSSRGGVPGSLGRVRRSSGQVRCTCERVRSPQAQVRCTLARMRSAFRRVRCPWGRVLSQSCRVRSLFSHACGALGSSSQFREPQLPHDAMPSRNPNYDTTEDAECAEINQGHLHPPRSLRSPRLIFRIHRPKRRWPWPHTAAPLRTPKQPSRKNPSLCKTQNAPSATGSSARAKCKTSSPNSFLPSTQQCRRCNRVISPLPRPGRSAKHPRGQRRPRRHRGDRPSRQPNGDHQVAHHPRGRLRLEQRSLGPVPARSETGRKQGAKLFAQREQERNACRRRRASRQAENQDRAAKLWQYRSLVREIDRGGEAGAELQAGHRQQHRAPNTAATAPSMRR